MVAREIVIQERAPRVLLSKFENEISMAAGWHYSKGRLRMIDIISLIDSHALVCFGFSSVVGKI